jgi:carbonyl reductase 1
LLSRDKNRGEDALRQIQDDPQLKKAKALERDGGLSEIKYHSLDITRSESIHQFASFLEKEHPEGIDFGMALGKIDNKIWRWPVQLSTMHLLQVKVSVSSYNLGWNICLPGDLLDVEVVRKTLACNYYGTLEVTRASIPLLRPGGRIVNVTSIMGSLGRYSQPLQDRFRSPASVDDITKIMEEFTTAVAEGNVEQAGFPRNVYGVSKAGTTGMTKIIAKEDQSKGKGLLINACHPGYVRTDMTRGRGVKTPDQGAQTPVLLAIHDIGGRTGEYWSDERVEPW